MEAGVARRTSGLPSIHGAWGWHGVEGSDLTVEMCSGSDSGRGFDRADCKGLSLGLAGRVWVFGQGRRDSDIEFGVRKLEVFFFDSFWSEFGFRESVILELGDKSSSVDWGGTQNFRTGFGGRWEPEQNIEIKARVKVLWVKHTNREGII